MEKILKEISSFVEIWMGGEVLNLQCAEFFLGTVLVILYWPCTLKTFLTPLTWACIFHLQNQSDKLQSGLFQKESEWEGIL